MGTLQFLSYREVEIRGKFLSIYQRDDEKNTHSMILIR